MAAARSIRKSHTITAPHFVKPLQDVVCKAGDEVLLECCVKGYPGPDVRWEKGDVPLPAKRHIRMGREGERCRLTIKSCNHKDSGKYSCIASNRAGTANSVASVFVKGTNNTLERQDTSRKRSKAPVFIIPPNNKVVNEGDNVRFLCSVQGYPQPIIRWTKVKKSLNTDERFSITENEGIYKLEICSVGIRDSGKYLVIAENSSGKVTAPVHLEVRAKDSKNIPSSPQIIRPLVTSTALDGRPYNLVCEIIGNPVPTLQWYKDSQPIHQSQDLKMSFDGQVAMLSINEVYPEDEGEYVCIARNSCGEVDTSCWLNVKDSQSSNQQINGKQDSPIFVNKLEDMEVTDGDSATLTVQVAGTHPIEIVWVHNDQEIKNCSDFSYNSSSDSTIHSLVIADVFPEDAGLYVCEAYNSVGEAETFCKLTVKERAVEIPKKNDKNIVQETTIIDEDRNTISEPNNSSEASLIESPNSKSIPDSPSFVCKTNGNNSKSSDSFSSSDLVSNSSSSSETKKFTRKRPPLINGDTKEAAESSVEIIRNEESTNNVNVVTPRLTPAQILRGPQNVSVLRGDTVTLRTHFIGQPNPLVTWLKGGKLLKNNSHVSITTEECMSVLVLQNVSADDSGKYVVTVENSGGSDCHFASVAVEGPPNPPAGKPNISDVTNHSLIISWYGSAYDGGSVITGYIVEMCTLPEKKWNRISAACHSTTYMVRDLLPERQYIFRIRAENVHGFSNPSIESDPVFVSERHSICEEDINGFPSFEHRIVEISEGAIFSKQYELQEEVGKGRFGIVYKCLEKEAEEIRAAKIVRCVKSRDKAKVREEVAIMNKLSHPKLLQLAAAYESAREMILVMEYISGGELFERVIADDFVLTEEDCILFMRQICEGVSYMHENCVIHLDLKPENILCKTKSSHQIKLIDFGLAKMYNPNESLRVLFGTPEFVAPEVISYEPVSPASDMWSVGVVCYVLLSGLSPFMGDSDAETFANITRAEYDFDDDAFESISKEAKDFMSQLLVKRPEKRLTASQCLQHSWLAIKQRGRKSIQLSTDKLKRFIIRRKWQKTGNAIRALGRMVFLSGISSSWSSLGSTSDSEGSSPASSTGRYRLANQGSFPESDDLDRSMRKNLIRPKIPEEEEEDVFISDKNSART